ncbi:sugar acetyltransferase [Niallia circulans]|uniref:acetyltransferase n=1 Tax=Niallia circulans TaxID=1397 RepID=UPI00201DB982|nr:acetyltransferase [Niallia circulans]UQZ76065.1 sugar acetyltransferase [Niallia circulans]
MQGKKIVIIGNGGHAAVLSEILIDQNYDILGFTAPQKERNRYGIRYLGEDEVINEFSVDEIRLVLGIGSINVSSIRIGIYKKFRERGYQFESIIHKDTIISASAVISQGVQIMAGSVLQPFVTIRENTIINTNCSIDHDCYIGSHCHIAPGSVLSGNVVVGEDTHIGTGSTVINNIKIGNKVLVGAGSVVVKDIMNDSKVHGVPAKYY